MTINELKNILKEEIKHNQTNNGTKRDLALCLHDRGVAICGVSIKEESNFVPHLEVDYIDDGKIEKAYVLISEVDEEYDREDFQN